MMALTSVAVSFWGKTVVVSTPLFWGVAKMRNVGSGDSRPRNI